MRSFFSFLTILIFVPVTASASSPGMIEGPPGCDWEANITALHEQRDRTLDVQLKKMHGTCMYAPGPCGDEGENVTVPLGSESTELFTPGQTVHIWVSGNKATLTHPNCKREPIDRNNR